MSYVTITSALIACLSIEFIAEDKILHALAVLSSLRANLVVRNVLLSMYGKSGMTNEAGRTLQMIPERDEVTWNALMDCQVENEKPNNALKAFNMMRQEGFRENYITIINILSAFSTLDGLRTQGMPIHAHIVQKGLDLDKCAYFSHNNVC